VKVTTIDGGFRGRKGVGNLTTDQLLSEVESFEARLGSFRQSAQIAKQRIAAGALSQADARSLDEAITALEERIDTHIARSGELQNASALLAWRAEAGRIVTLAQAFVQQSRALVQSESMSRPWKVAIALTIGTAVIGAAAWALGQVRS